MKQQSQSQMKQESKHQQEIASAQLKRPSMTKSLSNKMVEPFIGKTRNTTKPNVYCLEDDSMNHSL